MKLAPIIIVALLVPSAAAPRASAFEDEPFALSVGTLRVTSNTSAELTFTLSAAPGHHVYHEQMGAVVKSPPGVSLEQLVMPPPIVKADKVLGKEVRIYEGATAFTAKLRIPDRDAIEGRDVVLAVSYQGCSQQLCFMPTSVELRARFSAGGSAEVALQTEQPPLAATVSELRRRFAVGGLPAVRFTDSAGREYEGERLDGYVGPRKMVEALKKVAAGKGSYRKGDVEVTPATFLIAFLGGLLLTLTPCVWPMIPITTGIVLGARKTGTGMGLVLSSSYVLGLAAAYAIMGTVVASAGGLIGESLQSPCVLVAVSALFVAMALSMFGLYELPLMSVGGGKFGGGGVVASFVLGGVSAVVLSPCVGPVVASLLAYVAGTGRAVVGASALFVFGLGIGMPLIAIGTFSGAMGKLPKSGAWMVEVKKLFGAALLGFAVYFLFPLLPGMYEWIVSGAAAVLLGLGLIVFDVRKNSASAAGKAKLALGLLLIAGGMYAAGAAPRERAAETGIQWLDSFEDAHRAAAEQNKPVMIDFTAEWCAACKKMDKYTFSDEEVIRAADGVVPVRIDLTAARESGSR